MDFYLGGGVYPPWTVVTLSVPDDCRDRVAGVVLIMPALCTMLPGAATLQHQEKQLDIMLTAIKTETILLAVTTATDLACKS